MKRKTWNSDETDTKQIQDLALEGHASFSQPHRNKPTLHVTPPIWQPSQVSPLRQLRCTQWCLKILFPFYQQLPEDFWMSDLEACVLFLAISQNDAKVQ